MVRPYPVHTLEDALTIASAIHRSNAGLPFDRVLLAGALGTTPASSAYTMKLNSSAKYGLTEGGYNDPRISLTRSGEAIVAPKNIEERRRAIVQAALEPDVFGQLFRMLDGKRLPEDTYAQNMLQRELGIHPDLTKECLSIIKANGLYAELLSEVGDSLYVSLTDSAEDVLAHQDLAREGPSLPSSAAVSEPPLPRDRVPTAGRIFIGYVGSQEPLPWVQALLDDFGIPYAVTVTDEADSLPVPAQVSKEMRGCSAAVLALGGHDSMGGADSARRAAKMLCQLGAASMLYGDKVVILREAGSEREPGVGQVRCVTYDGERPDAAALALLRELHRAGVARVVT